MEPMEERVARGAAVLDIVQPNWPLKIDLAELVLADGEKCILGQLFEGACERYYDSFMAEWVVADRNGFSYGRAFLAPPSEYDWSARHGFIVAQGDYDGVDDDEAWKQLQDCWEAAIKDRLDAGVPVEA